MIQILEKSLIILIILIILKIFFKKWRPLIKEQYIFIIVSIIGCTLGYFLLDKYGTLISFIIIGFVFYKNKLVEEINSVKNCIKKMFFIFF